MAAELGVGVRAWIEWQPDDAGHFGTGRFASARTCTIDDGPFERGTKLWIHNEGAFYPPERCWNVLLDGIADGFCFVPERLLHPINDDGEPVETERRDTEPVGA